MPAVRPRRRPTPRRILPAAVLFVACAALSPGPSPAQPPKPPAAETRAAAIKLPDGTVVFFTKNPDDPNPPVDGVILSGKEYKALVDQADAAKKGRDPAKPQAPSGCAVRGKVQAAGDSQLAALTLTYTVQTTAPRTTVFLGCGRGFPRAARLADGKLPILGATDDGLTVFLEAAGEHTLTIDLDAPVVPRGAKGELGFELGLPRAAITTFAFEPPPGGVKSVTVGTRTPDRPTEVRRNSFPVERLAASGGQPLGPTDLLDVTWDAPTTTAPPPAADTALVADTEVAVRVDESQIEATAKIRVRGPSRDWQIALPPGADVTATRATPAGPAPEFPAASPTLVRPPDPNKPVWTLKLPEGPAAEWVVTATVRQSRPKLPDPKNRGPYPVGPFAVPAATRQTTVARVSAPPSVRVRVKHGPDVRPQNPPAGADEELVGVYKATATAQPGRGYPPPLFELDATPAKVFVRVEPAYRLRRTEAGWRLDANLKVTPVRAEIEQVVVEVPEGWQTLEAGPPDVVDEVHEQKEGKTRVLTVRLVTGQRAAFGLTLTGTFPVPAAAKTATIGLPRFPQAIEQNARVTATVPEGLEIRGTATAWENGQPAGVTDLKPDAGEPKPGAGVAAASAAFEKGVGRVDVGWQPHRPELDADVRADVTIQDRQVVVAQTVRFRAADGGGRPVRLRGPVTATGLRGVPPPDPVGPGEWVFRPPADAGKDFTLSLSYGLPIPAQRAGDPGPTRVPVGLIWPDPATRVTAGVRVWTATARRVTRYDGPWRELAPEADRETLPLLTLAGSGTGLPLAFDMGEPGDGSVPQVWVDRAYYQAWVGDDRVAVRARFLLRRWSTGSADVTLPAGVVPEVTLDGRKVTDLGVGGDPQVGFRTVRIPLSEPRPGRSSVVLEVRYQLPAVRGTWAAVPLVPPTLAAASSRTPARWHVTVPPDVTPLAFADGWQTEARWAVRGGLATPVPLASAADLEQWFAAGGETDPESDWTPAATDADALTGRQPTPATVDVYRVPRSGWIAGCSVVTVLLGVGLTRVRVGLVGPAVAAVGAGAAVAAAIWPQPAAQVVTGCQPGLWAVGLLLGGQVGLRWYHRRRVTHLPGFTRARREPVTTGTGVSPVPDGIGSATGSGSVPRVIADEPQPPARS